MNIQEYLRDLLDLLLLENYEIEMNEDEENIFLHIMLPEEDSGILIGKHGETLQAIQLIMRMVFLETLGEKRLSVNINDYRDQREERVREMVRRGIDKIRGTNHRFYLSRLNSAERYFAHNLIGSDEEYQDYKSYSIDGEDGERVLIIELK
jgi:spoIIIJ-associated protein